MKINTFSILIISILIILLSCEKKDNNPNLEDFCSVIPNGWECEIIQDTFNANYIPRNANTPIAIVKYINQTREFTGSVDFKINPSLILDLYSIQQKEELIQFIRSQQLYSWCIPRYYGETEKYFIITSPCFINGGYFTEEANSCIEDLHSALKSIITVKEYNFVGD